MYFDIYDSGHFPYGTHCFYTVISGHKTSLADFTGITRVEHGSNHGEAVLPLPSRPGVLTLPSPAAPHLLLAPGIRAGWKDNCSVGLNPSAGPRQKDALITSLKESLLIWAGAWDTDLMHQVSMGQTPKAK